MLKNLVLNQIHGYTFKWKKSSFWIDKICGLSYSQRQRRDKYLSRATKIKNKQGELTYTNPESANFWSVNLLWPKKI